MGRKIRGLTKQFHHVTTNIPLIRIVEEGAADIQPQRTPRVSRRAFHHERVLREERAAVTKYADAFPHPLDAANGKPVKIPPALSMRSAARCGVKWLASPCAAGT